MIPAAFDYVRAGSLQHAIDLLAQHGDDAKVLAGGHSLIPLLKLRLARPSVVVDLAGVPGLAYIRPEGDQIAIGALTRQRDLERSELLAEQVPLLSTAAGSIGDPQVRNRGTFGGSLAHGDGAADLPAVALALGATMVLAGPSGRREVAAEQFFRGFLETAVEPEELLVEVRVPRAPGPHAFVKFRRRAQDWAIVGVAAATVGERTNVALVNMASVPVRAAAVEAALAAGGTPSEAAGLADEGTDPPSDIHGSGAYRRHLSRVLVGRALARMGESDHGHDVR
jgi:carbon-monoxide dehydrogenase medium subunit